MRTHRLFLYVFSLFLFTGFTACSKKTGCPINEEANTKNLMEGRKKKYKTRTHLIDPKKTKKRNKG